MNVAIPRQARLVEVAALGADTRHLRLQMEGEASLGFVGGQYIIVDSGLVLPNGKACKRAYSIISADDQQHTFELAVMRLGAGLGSTYMHELAPGAPVNFSGPWGKMGPPVDAGAGPGDSFVLASDTGLTSMLGLLQARRFQPLLAGTTFLWLRPSADYFVPRSFVERRLPAGLRDVRFVELPPIGDPRRVPLARRLLAEAWAQGPLGRGYIAGDGAINYALLDDLVAGGVAATREHVESFFNMPKKSEPAPIAAPVAAAT
jgi:ferredoxin-NADP reductase